MDRSHASPSRLRSLLRDRSGRLRALLSVGVLLGVGSVNTMAFFTDDATMTTGNFTSGTLDIRLNADTNNVGQGGTWANTSFAIANLIPGESVASSFPVRNDGTVPFKWSTMATASGTLAPQLRFTTYLGGTAANTGTQAAGNRAGTCTGGTAQTTDVTLNGTAVNVITQAAAGTIAVGASQAVCVRVQLVSTAPNTAQGQTASASYVFNAVQVNP